MAFPYTEMVKEWNGSFVHRSEFEAKHPQLEPRKHKPDAQALQDARTPKKLNPSELSKETGFSKNLFKLYNLLIQIKELLMESVDTFENVDCFIEEKKCTHEGYVMTNQYGTFKLVNRRQFSYANFNLNKKWNK